jgi:hypothetical protein
MCLDEAKRGDAAGAEVLRGGMRKSQRSESRRSKRGGASRLGSAAVTFDFETLRREGKFDFLC